jgi:hypothetical protein
MEHQVKFEGKQFTFIDQGGIVTVLDEDGNVAFYFLSGINPDSYYYLLLFWHKTFQKGVEVGKKTARLEVLKALGL